MHHPLSSSPRSCFVREQHERGQCIAVDTPLMLDIALMRDPRGRVQRTCAVPLSRARGDGRLPAGVPVAVWEFGR